MDKLQCAAYHVSEITLAWRPALTTLLSCLCWLVQASGDAKANVSLISAKHPETTADVSTEKKKRPLIQELS